jgi:hypothetical protein
MANVKQISIVGELPFNCDQHYEMRQMLGQLNAPICGLRMNWLGSAGSRESGFGGSTEIIAFKISGNEAVSNPWINLLLIAIVKAGGEISQVNVRDTDNQEDIQFEIPKHPIDEDDRLEFICPVMFTVQDSEEAFELHQLQKWLEQAVYVDLQTEDCGNVDGKEESDATVSMGMMLDQLNHA